MVDFTHKEKIVRAILAVLEAMTDDAGNRLWNAVARGDPDNLSVRAVQVPLVYVEEGDDVVSDRLVANYADRTLRIYFHVRFERAHDVDPYERFNYYLGLLQYALLPDPVCFLGGLAITIEEVAAVPEVYVNDNTPGGQFVVDVKYRTPRSNPYL